MHPSPVVRRLTSLAPAAIFIALTVGASAPTANAATYPPYLVCAWNALDNRSTVEESLRPAEGALALPGSTVRFTGRSRAPLGFQVASSKAALASPDVDAGAGTEEAPAAAGDLPRFSFLSTAAAARARTVYWTASFSNSAIVGCTGQPAQTYTTIARKLVVSDSASQPPQKGAAKECVVPRLHGKTLREARRALAAASCRLGGISRRRGAKKLVVRWQRPRPGRRLPAGAPVAVVLGPPVRRR
jgi:hypothetical protein